MRHASFYSCAVTLAVLGLAGNSFAALASGGKATTSANLSTNPTVRKQQLLMDPGSEDAPLILTLARLDVAIHLDTPFGVTAQNIVQSIDVSPISPFTPVGTLPFYHNTDSFFNVSFLPSGRDILISDITVKALDPNLPPPGEVDHAKVDVQFNDVLPFDIYKNILGTYTVTVNSNSQIQGADPANHDNITIFDSDHITPATDSGFLGAPEPGMAGLLVTVLSVWSMKRPGSGYRRARR